jgi:hypothetical protein
MCERGLPRLFARQSTAISRRAPDRCVIGGSPLAQLLVEHDLRHLDLHEITTSCRAVTQTIATELYDQGAVAVRFPSRLDGKACVALFQGRGTANAAGDQIALTDAPPVQLTNVTTPWGPCAGACFGYQRRLRARLPCKAPIPG